MDDSNDEEDDVNDDRPRQRRRLTERGDDGVK